MKIILKVFGYIVLATSYGCLFIASILFFGTFLSLLIQESKLLSALTYIASCVPLTVSAYTTCQAVLKNKGMPVDAIIVKAYSFNALLIALFILTVFLLSLF